jgi:hypothetical protein
LTSAISMGVCVIVIGSPLELWRRRGVR